MSGAQAKAAVIAGAACIVAESNPVAAENDTSKVGSNIFHTM
jgi:urocanate hydratase